MLRSIVVLAIVSVASVLTDLRAEAADQCIGKTFVQRPDLFGKQKKFRAVVKELGGCGPLKVSKGYLDGSCTDRENNFADQNFNCGSKGKVQDASTATCNKVFSEGGSDDFETVSETYKEFDYGLICKPTTKNNNQKVHYFFKTSCNNATGIDLGYQQATTDSCPASGKDYSTRSDSSYKGNYENEGKHSSSIFEKISKAIFSVIIIIICLLLACCVGVTVFFVLRKRRSRPAQQQGTQMQQQPYGGGYNSGAGPPPGYGQAPGGYPNQNYGGNAGQQGYGQQGYQKDTTAQKPAGYPASGQPVQGQPVGYPQAV